MLLTGVGHVMGLFAKHFFENHTAAPAEVKEQPVAAETRHNARMEELIELLCDEEAIDNV